jgi:hypothetical protein
VLGSAAAAAEALRDIYKIVQKKEQVNNKHPERPIGFLFIQSPISGWDSLQLIFS